MKVTRTFRRSGIAVAFGIAACVLAGNGVAGGVLLPLGVLALVFSVPVFAVSATRHLLRGILWRVGSRLFVSYLLLILPVFLVVGVAFLGLVVLTGQLSARRVEAAFSKRTAALAVTAQDLASGLSRAADPARRRALLEAAVRDKDGTLPRLGAVWSAPGRPVESAGDVLVPDLLPRTWILPGRQNLIARAGTKPETKLFSAAIESSPEGTLVVTLPLEKEFRKSLAAETGTVLSIQGATVTTAKDPKHGLVSVGGKRPTGVSISDGNTATNVELDTPKAPEETAAKPAGSTEPSGVFAGRWVAFPLLLSQPIVAWDTGTPAANRQVLVLVRSSLILEYHELFGRAAAGSGTKAGSKAGTAEVVVVVMGLLATLAGCAYLLATAIAAFLVFRIARATRRLSVGFAEIEKGNFGARAELKGRDQLAELIASFNRMGAHLSASVAERAEKEAIEHELGVARDLQRRLLPPPDFAFPGFDIAVDFRPAAVIGGDFYDFVAEKGKLTVVVADVSGHGLPTGIVMAAAKASLSALARSGSTGATLLTQLDEEILRTTDSRTFVTLAHLEFRVDDRTVVFTNAGHLYPYRVTREGTVHALENPARPLGLALPASFRSVTAPLAPGDLWVVLSDGIIEATAKGGDEEFGFVRLEQALARSAGMSAATVKEQILSDWRTFTRGDEPEDDRTLVVLRTRDESPDPA